MNSQLVGKDPNAGKIWNQKAKRAAENETVRQHHRLNGYKFEQTLGDSERQGSLACCSPWGHRVGHDLVTEQQWKNWQKTSVDISPKKTIQMTKRHMTRCSISNYLRNANQNFNEVSSSVRIATSKMSPNNKFWRGCEEQRTFLPYWWECKLVHLLWRTVWRVLKTLKIVTLWSCNPIPRDISTEYSYSKICLHPSVHGSTIYNSKDEEAT